MKRKTSVERGANQGRPDSCISRAFSLSLGISICPLQNVKCRDTLRPRRNNIAGKTCLSFFLVQERGELFLPVLRFLSICQPEMKKRPVLLFSISPNCCTRRLPVGTALLHRLRASTRPGRLLRPSPSCSLAPSFSREDGGDCGRKKEISQRRLKS